MSKKANPTTVGAFLVGALGLAVAGILIFGSGALFRDEFHFVAHFRSSVKGLDVGAPVRFRGVQIGTVNSVEAVWDSATETARIPVGLSFEGAMIRVDDDHKADSLQKLHRLIELGLRAELALDSFVTGKLYVALEFYPDSPATIVGGTKLPELPTTETALEKLAKNISEIPFDDLVERAIDTMETVSAFLDDPVAVGAREDLGRLLAEAADRIGPLADSTQSTLDETRGFIRDADAHLETLSTDVLALVKRSEEELSAVSTDLRALIQNVDGQLDPASTAAIAALEEARETIARLHEGLNENYTVFYRTSAMMEELTSAARAIRVLAEMLERHPEAPLTGKPGR